LTVVIKSLTVLPDAIVNPTVDPSPVAAVLVYVAEPDKGKYLIEILLPAPGAAANVNVVPEIV